jgi:hypothetical protein
MSATPVLAFPNFNLQFVIETDACDKGVEAFFSRDGHPVAYFSKALSVNNQRLSTCEKEFLAILMAVDKWRNYMSRQPFLIRTDHKSLCHLQDQSLSIEMQRKAMTKLAGLPFKLQYKKVQKIRQLMPCPGWAKAILYSLHLWLFQFGFRRL